MRKTFIAMTIATVALATGGATASAATATRTLKAHVVATDARWVGAATATMAAYRVDGAIRTRTDDGLAHTIPMPEGCDVTAAGSGLLAGECGPMTPNPDLSTGTLHLGVWRLDGSEVTRFDVTSHEDIANGYGSSPPLEVGAEWIGLADSSKISSWWEYVNWRTHEVRQVYGTDARKISDVNRPELDAALCAPVTRVVFRGPKSHPTYLDAVVRWPYVLLATREGATLRRCGGKAHVSLPEGFEPVTLGYGWVAGWDETRLQLVRLSDRRRFTVSGVKGMVNLTLTRGRLYTYSRTVPGTVRTVTLPKH